MRASHTALPVTSTGLWERFSLSAGLPLLGQPSFGAGVLPERIRPPSENSTQEWAGGCSQRIYSLAETEEARTRFLQRVGRLPSNLLFIGCENTAFWDRWQGKESRPQLGARKPWDLPNSCSKYPKSKLEPFSAFSPERHFEEATNTNSSNFIPFAFSAQPWGVGQQGGDPLEGSCNPAHFWCVTYTTRSALGFSSLLPSPSNSNLSLAGLFPPPKLTLAGKGHAPQRRAEDPLRADAAAAARLHVTSPQTSGQRGIHSHLPLLPESHLLASMRQPDRRHKRAQKRLYLSVQIQLCDSGGSVTVGTFLLSFFLADRTHPRDFTSGRNALKRFLFFFFFLWWGCFKTYLYFKQQHWRLLREGSEPYWLD